MKQFILFLFLSITANLTFAVNSGNTIVPQVETVSKKEVKKQNRISKKIEKIKSKLGNEADSLQIGAIIAAFFLGGIGLHRVVMGGTPLLMLGYLFTFGGFFGLLPLIDIIRLILNPDHYRNNDRFFAAFES